MLFESVVGSVFSVRPNDEHDGDEFAVQAVWKDIDDIVRGVNEYDGMATSCSQSGWRNGYVHSGKGGTLPSAGTRILGNITCVRD